MSLEQNTTSSKRFYKEIRDFSQRTKPWEQAIYYDTTPDEVNDITLVSERVYGNREEFLTIMASAGLDTMDQQLKQQRLVLPTSSQLYQIKRIAGFESLSEFRSNFKPTWIS